MSNRWSQVLALKPLEDYPKQTFELALPHGKMLNHIRTSTKNPQLKVHIDGYKVIVTYAANHHYKSLDDLEKLAIYGSLVEKQDDLHTVIPYDEDIDIRKPLHMSFKSLYRKYKDGQLDLEPAYQRAFVWTPEQQEAYLLGLFHETATIEPTLVQYYKDGFPDEIYEVLDGKQRLTTLINFVEGKTTVKGLTFDQITNSDQRYIWGHPVKYTRVINNDSFEDIKPETKWRLFQEINALGTKLSDEDIARAEQHLLNKD